MSGDLSPGEWWQQLRSWRGTTPDLLGSSSHLAAHCGENITALSLDKLLHYCTLIGRELQSVEIFSCS